MNDKAMSTAALGGILLMAVFILIILGWLVYTYAPGIVGLSNSGSCEKNNVYKEAKCMAAEQDCLSEQKDVIPGGAGCPKETPVCCAKTG
jgi:hypothetical protein